MWRQMAASGLVIKLIYEGERNATQKIRKLFVKEGEAPTLRFLRESFSLPSVRTLFYYDADGDQITISNDRELQSAIGENKLSDTLRIYTPEDDGSGMQQHGTEQRNFLKCSCSNCGNSIGRFIYKCVICNNVKFCGRCEAFGVHSAHDIIRLTNERLYPSQFFNRLYRLYDTMNGSQSMISLHPLPPLPLGSIPSFPSAATEEEDFNLITAESAPLTVRQLSKSDESLNDYSEAKPSPSPQEEGLDSGNTYHGVLQTPVTVLLKDEFQVHEAREANSEEILGSLCGLRKEIDKLLTDETDNEDSLRDTEKSVTPLVADSTENESSSTYDLIKVISFEEAKEDITESKEQESCPSTSSLTKSSYDDYVPAYTSHRTRNLLNESSLYSHKYLTTTQKVSDSLEQMKAMGFSDDDGWLTQVLTMERGNIDKVLDILTPVNK